MKGKFLQFALGVITGTALFGGASAAATGFMRTEIPQEITGPRLCFASGVTVVKRHRHKAQAYRHKAQAYREGV